MEIFGFLAFVGKRRFNFIVLMVCAVFLQTGVISCKTEKDPDHDTSTLDIARVMVDTVGNELVLSITGMPTAVLSHLKQCAMSELIEQNLLTSGNVVLITTAIADGMMTGLGSYQDSDLSTEPSDDSTVQSPHKKQAIASIAGQLIQELIQTLTGDDLSAAINDVLVSITSGFASAGLAAGDMGSVAGAVINRSIHTLDDLELDDSARSDLFCVLLQATIAGVGSESNQLTADSIKEAVKSSIVSVIVALHEIEILNDDIIAQLEAMITSSVTGLGEAGITAAELAEISDSIKTGVVEGLHSIGVSNTVINETYPTVKEACDRAVETYINANPDAISRDLLVNLVYTNLAQIDGTTDIALNSDQRNRFRANLISDTDQAGLANSDNLNDLLPVSIESVMTTLGMLSPALTDLEKEDVLENLLGSFGEFLIGRISGADAIEVLETAAQPAVDNIGRLQLATVQTYEATEAVCYGLIKPLGTIPLGEKTVADAASAIVARVINRSASLGLDASGEQAAIQSCVTGAIKGLEKTDLSLDDHNDAVAGLISVASGEAVANLIAAGKTGTELIAAMPDLSNLLISAVAAAGLSTAACSELAADIVSGAAGELSSILETEALSEALTNAVDGIKSGLEAAGASAEEIESAEKSGMEASDTAVTGTVSPTEAKLIVSEEKLSTMEGSSDNGSFKVSLDKIPTADVTVTIVSKDFSEGTVVPSSLLLTAQNWNKPQTVFIKPVDDGFVDKEISYSIVLKTDSGIRKTLTAKNADNDVVGIRVTPTRKQYTSEAGGQAWYAVTLKSQPLDTIVLRWAITNGKNSVDIVANRVMTFISSQWNSTQLLKIQGKVCGDCEEHTAVMVESQNIIAVNGTDADYPALSPESISLTNLKLGPVMKQTNAASNNTVTVTFNNPIFATVDDAYIYETVFESETIAMTYAPYQSRPVLIKNSCTDSSGNIRTTTTPTTVTDPITQIQTTTYSHSFCLSFYNASTSRTQVGMNGWYTVGTVSCTGNGGMPNLVTCSFSGSGSTPASNTIPGNTVFNEYSGNSAIGLVFDTTPGAGSAEIIPDAHYQASQPTVSLSYKPLSVVEGSYTAQFRSAVPMQSGFWYLSSQSKSLLREGGDYGPTRYFYIYVP